jgi:hypothetical protein
MILSDLVMSSVVFDVTNKWYDIEKVRGTAGWLSSRKRELL